MDASIELLPHQYEFCTDNTTRYLALCGGYGCGKTFAFVAKAIQLAFLNGGSEGAVLEPTIDMARRILVPEMINFLDNNGIDYVYRKADKEFIIYTPKGPSKIHVLSGENYTRLVGLNLAWFGVDEVDTIRNKDVAKDMFDVLISRIRDKSAPNIQGYFTSTPEGFHFLYDTFEKEVAEKGITDRKLIRGRTMDNPHLADGFIDSLLQNYTKEQCEAYLNGHFINLNTGTIYYAFNRKDNHSDVSLDDPKYAKHILHIGMDFNVGKCSAVTHLVVNGDPVAVDEIQGVKNTEEMIKLIKQKYPNRVIRVYPDASGKNEKTNSNQTDHILLKNAGFKVVAKTKNPYVKDRITTMNAMFCNNKGERRYKVNTRKCPVYTTCLEQQSYAKNGEPDKMHDQDHPNDAAGYFITTVFPMKSRASIRVR